jgi:hypothetical protein
VRTETAKSQIRDEAQQHGGHEIHGHIQANKGIFKPKKNYTGTSYIRLCIIGHHSVALSLTATTTSRTENNNKQRYLNIAANKGSRIIQHPGVQI